MLEVLMLVLFALWLIGMLLGQQFDGFIHLLLIGIAAAFGIRYFTGQKPVD
jgi:1,4-dihydroxy-2-naphthoate octaprenyltransferase